LKSGKAALLTIGVIILLTGAVFALQGADVIGGSSLMSGNSQYIYIGGAVAAIGLALMLLASRIDRGTSSPPAPTGGV